MKLYYSPGTCALAVHIVLEELGMVYEVEQVNLRDKTTASGDYYQVNPKGAVPALRMDDGEILTEANVIMQYLADQKPERMMVPSYGTMERYRLMEMMNYISMDLHRSYSPLFAAGRLVKDEKAQEELRANIKEMLMPKLTAMNAKLAGKNFLFGESMCIADAYFYTIMTWNKHWSIDTSKWGNISSFMTRMNARPGVLKALKAEGLLK